MRRKINFLLVLIVLGSALNAQQLTQNFTFSPDDVQTSAADVYDVVMMEDESGLMGEEHAGKPQLPVKQFKLLLPQNASATNVSITINSEQLLAGSFYIYPVQLPVYPNYESPPPFVEPDPAIYNSNNPFPSNYIFEYNTSGFRDYNYVTVSFMPFRYIPLSRQLYLLTSVTITVDYSVNPQSETHKLRPYGSVDEAAYELIEGTVINPIQLNVFIPVLQAKYHSTGYPTGAVTKLVRFCPPNCLPSKAAPCIMLLLPTIPMCMATRLAILA